MIWLAVFATIRIGFDAISKFVSPWSWIPSLLVWFDLGIAIWLFCTFACLGGFHFAARREEDKIRCAADEKEPEILKRLSEKKEAAPEQRTSDVMIELDAHVFLTHLAGSESWLAPINAHDARPPKNVTRQSAFTVRLAFEQSQAPCGSHIHCETLQCKWQESQISRYRHLKDFPLLEYGKDVVPLRSRPIIPELP